MRRAEAETPIERQHAFDSIFPPQKIRDFEEGGDSDWIGLFDALKAFNHGFTPEGEEPRAQNDSISPKLIHPYNTTN